MGKYSNIWLYAQRTQIEHVLLHVKHACTCTGTQVTDWVDVIIDKGPGFL